MKSTECRGNRKPVHAHLTSWSTLDASEPTNTSGTMDTAKAKLTPK